MAEPSDKTKNSVSKMSLGGIGKSLLGGAKKFVSWNLRYKGNGLFSDKPTSELVDKNNMPPAKVLGEIYKMMKIMDEDKKLNHEMANSHLESEELKKDTRNKEIIKALTGRKKKKPVTPKKRKTKKEQEVTKPTSKTGGKGKEPEKVPEKTTEKPSNKPAEDKKAKDAADAKKAENERAAQEKEAKRLKDEEEKAAARQKQLEKEKADAKRAQEEADRKTAEAKTDAERKAAERAKEEANRKAAEAEKKAADEAKARAKSEAERKAAEEEKKRLLEEEKKRVAEETKRKAAEEEKKRLAEEEKKRLAEEAKAESKRTLEATDKAQNRSSRRLKGEEEARKTAEKLKAEKELARKKAEEEARRTAEQNKPVVTTPPPTVSSSPIIPGISAAAAASMSLEVGATTKESALQSVGKWVPNDPEPGVFSYGLFGINSKRKNGKDSSIDSFISDNPQFNLPDPGNSKQFIKAWEKLAKEKPEEMYKAQLKWYKDRVEDPTVATLSKYAPKEIYSNPAVVLYMSDRANQYGPLANWTNGLKYAEGSKDYKEFLRKVSEYDKDHLEQSFKTYLANNPNNKKGLEERIKRRLERALNLRVETTPNVIPNQNGNTINDSSIQNQRGKNELKEQQQSSLGSTNTTIVNQQVNSPAKNTETDDSSPWYKKLFGTGK